MQRAFSQLANGKTKKFVLTGADGNLGRVAADYILDIAKPEEQVVITSYDLKTLPTESIKRWESKGAIVAKADYDDVEEMKRVFDGADAVALIST
ncbi:hypothetical protein V7S43_018090 [Phytophthora oleae]|uniref:NmrA-like domain-containing protein n=1 Tax=Phytophthora oleae TaxID=2107226 RepID=A0ABD3ERV1_9STRA